MWNALQINLFIIIFYEKKTACSGGLYVRSVYLGMMPWQCLCFNAV